MMNTSSDSKENITRRDRVVGCILAGSIGDALGAPVEFLTAAQIEAEYGSGGPSDYGVAFGYRGTATDDTQMTLFTLEGLVRAHVQYRVTGRSDIVASVHRSYLRWLYTQDGQVSRSLINGQLLTERALFEQRAPGTTCLEALRATVSGASYGTPDHPLNSSKGCGAVMRAAPVAFWPGATSAEVFRLGSEIGAITHGHPSGYLSAGALAIIVQRILEGDPLPTAIAAAEVELVKWAGHEEISELLVKAQNLARLKRPSPGLIAAELGGGWVGEEALAIALYAALAATDLLDGLRLAINHSGDSDSTGSICGNILGALYGEQAIPNRLRDHVGLGGIASTLALNALAEFGENPSDSNFWLAKFPPE
jgi:ADP-ribosyl-[dinitrogen reductase] hydrolase